MTSRELAIARSVTYASLFDYPLTLDAAEFMVRMVPTDDEPTLRALGMTLRPVRDSLEDAMRWMAATGHLSAEAAGRLAPD